MSAEVDTPLLTPEQARELTDEVKLSAARLWVQVLDLYEGKAHLALGYENWHHYWETEMETTPQRADQYVRSGRVARVLERAGLPIPTNDRTARELDAVLRVTPEDLVPLWSRIIAANPRPNFELVREQVRPYREMGVGKHGMRSVRPADPGTVERRALSNRHRNLVGVALANLQIAAETAQASLNAALDTEPAPQQLHTWLGAAERATGALTEVTEQLRAQVIPRGAQPTAGRPRSAHDDRPRDT